MPRPTLALFLLLAAAPAFAQLAAPTPPTPPRSPREPFVLRMQRADDPATANIAPSGTWWRSPETIKALTLTPDQQHKMEDIFRSNRLQLVDLKASLEKEQINLEPLLNTNPPDTTKAMAEISRIADLRADLEKANARMLLGLRALLTADQWTKLQSLHPTGFVAFPQGSHERFHSNSRTSSAVTCTKNKATGQSECTTTNTTSSRDDNGHPTTTTCVTAPGQLTPKCTTAPALP